MLFFHFKIRFPLALFDDGWISGQGGWYRAGIHKRDACDQSENAAKLQKAPKFRGLTWVRVLSSKRVKSSVIRSRRTSTRWVRRRYSRSSRSSSSVTSRIQSLHFAKNRKCKFICDIKVLKLGVLHVIGKLFTFSIWTPEKCRHFNLLKLT